MNLKQSTNYDENKKNFSSSVFQYRYFEPLLRAGVMLSNVLLGIKR